MKAVFLLVVVSPIAIVACGGSSESASAGGVTIESGPLSKSDFALQASEICTKLLNRQYRRFERLVGSPAYQNIAQDKVRKRKIFETVFLPTLEGQIEQITALGAPEGDAEQVVAYLAILQKGIEVGERQPKKLLVRNSVLVEASKKAEVYGIDGCITADA